MKYGAWKPKLDWLIHHDAEARLHKIYAALLIVMGLLSGSAATSSPFWQTDLPNACTLLAPRFCCFTIIRPDQELCLRRCAST
jgi:hypothetical protein